MCGDGCEVEVVFLDWSGGAGRRLVRMCSTNFEEHVRIIEIRHVIQETAQLAIRRNAKSIRSTRYQFRGPKSWKDTVVQCDHGAAVPSVFAGGKHDGLKEVGVAVEGERGPRSHGADAYNWLAAVN